MNAVSTLKARMRQTKDLQQLREGVVGNDADLMGNGYCVCIYDLCLLPSASEAEKALLDAAVEVAKKYEANARRMVLDEALSGMVAVWEDEIPGLAEKVQKDRGWVCHVLREQLKRAIECLKIDEGDYDA